MFSNPPVDDSHPGPFRRLAARARLLAAHARPLTLRARLLLVLIGIVTVLCAALGTVSILSVYGFQLDQRDEQLISAADRTRRTPPPGTMPNAPPEFARGQQDGMLLARISDGEFTFGLIRGSDEDELLTSQARAELLKLPADRKPRTVDLPGWGEYRVVRMPANGRLGEVRSSVTGLPLADLNETRQWFIAIEVMVGLIAVLLAAGTGTVMVQFTLRPLNRVAATAGRVARLPLVRGDVSLADRVPPADADPRTEVGRVGAAVNHMLGHIAEALAARQASETRLRQFIADASHELRTPLAAIRGYTELARRDPAAAPPAVAYAIERVECATGRMTTLVEDLLLLARLDAGRPLRMREVDLSALMVEATSDAHVAGGQHRWTLDLPSDAVTVLGDRERLHQVVANLLTNARVHTPPGTTVTISLSAEQTYVMIRVVDDGPGIPDDLRQKVFERFARGDSSRSRSAGSSGLGLAIVSSVVAAHHGTVDVASSPGATAFTVRLPPFRRPERG